MRLLSALLLILFLAPSIASASSYLNVKIVEVNTSMDKDPVWSPVHENLEVYAEAHYVGRFLYGYNDAKFEATIRNDQTSHQALKINNLKLLDDILFLEISGESLPETLFISPATLTLKVTYENERASSAYSGITITNEDPVPPEPEPAPEPAPEQEPILIAPEPALIGPEPPILVGQIAEPIDVTGLGTPELEAISASTTVKIGKISGGKFVQSEPQEGEPVFILAMANGAPLINAQVVVENPKTGEFATLTTNNLGLAQIQSYQGDPLQIRIESDGYVLASEEVAPMVSSGISYWMLLPILVIVIPSIIFFVFSTRRV